jgi:hypothetical protein
VSQSDEANELGEGGKWPRHPENAPGPFYVENPLCIICGVPQHEAPDLIGFSEDPSGRSHCFFWRQPETDEEVERAISAVAICCCGAYRYGGDNPGIIRQLLQVGVDPGQIDAL